VAPAEARSLQEAIRFLSKLRADLDGDADRAHDLRVILNCQIPIL
jgi:hypothetical protein